MGVLPLSSILSTTPLSVDGNRSPQPRRSSKSFNNLRGSHHPRVFLARNWFGGVNSEATFHGDFYLPNRPVHSAVTLSPIAASPVCSPQPTIHQEVPDPEVRPGSPVGSGYITAPTSPTPELAAPTTLVDRPRELEELHILPSTLSMSVPAPLLTQPYTSQATSTIGKSVQDVAEEHSSFSESSLGSRQVMKCNFENPDTSAACPTDVAMVSSQRRANLHIPQEPYVNDDKGRIKHTSNERPQPDCTGSKDRIRRFYALKELLTTECGYLNDLRALVTVYFHSLPTYRKPRSVRSSSSLATDVRVGSYSPCLNAELSDIGSLNASTHGKDLSKLAPSDVFPEDKLVILARNAETVLQFHECFLRELKVLMKPFGITIDIEQDNDKPSAAILADLDEAIKVAAQQFTQEAPSFHIYQDFCAAHLEALEIVKAKQRQHPLDWDTFERHCTLVISTKADGVGVPSGSSLPGGLPIELDRTLSVGERKRTASLTALDGAFRSLRTFASREPVQLSRSDRYTPRLAFVDYLIKPVQRICRYPLLLAQLQQRGSLQESSSNVDVVVERSVKAMKHVVAAADEARHSKDMATKSSLIASRILRFAAPGSPYHLSDVFLSSLGTCLLAGSLDTIYYPSTKLNNDLNNMEAKYLGAFLYPGGYLILVRVKGKMYQPKHWFSLADFDLRDVTEDIALLSSSFCLQSDNHLFELAAACPREKDIWLTAIRESLEHSPTWAWKSVSSLNIQDHWESCLGQSETDILSASLNSEPCLLDQKSSQRLGFTQINISLKPEPNPPSARRSSSSVSLKAIFTQGGDSDAIFIRRSSMSARQQTDVGLQDVLSQACLGVRAYNGGEELFQVPPFSRSNSSVSVRSLARTGLSRLETVRIARRNSLPIGKRTAARWELLEAKSVMLRARSRKAICVTDYSSTRQKQTPASFLDCQVLEPHSPRYVSTDSVRDSSRSPFYNLKGFFQSLSASDVNHGAASHHLSVGNHSLQRAKTTENVFRRLSVKNPFYRNIRSAQSGMTNDKHNMSCRDHALDLSPGGTPIRRRTISRWPPTLDNVG